MRIIYSGVRYGIPALARWLGNRGGREVVEEGAERAFKHGYNYDPRVRARGVQDPKAHNFPYSFDDEILSTTPIRQGDGSLLFRKPGALNGREGFYEIGVNPGANTIFHRTFVGNK